MVYRDTSPWTNMSLRRRMRDLTNYSDHVAAYINDYSTKKIDRPRFNKAVNESAHEFIRRGVTRLQSVRRQILTRRGLASRINNDPSFKRGLTYNPYTRRRVRYNKPSKPTHRMVYNPYAKTHTKIKIGKPTHRLVYNPYSKKFSKHECRSALCGCS